MQLHIPSPQQIYDLSTQQLSQLRNQLAYKLSGGKNVQQILHQKTSELQQLQQLLETIQLEISQRETIEYFTQLCMNDGTAKKYLKEVEDFNNQFKKLANEMIGRSQNQTESQRKHSLKDDESLSRTTDNDESGKENNRTQSDFTQSKTSQLSKKAGQTITKKMGLGHPNMKKSKNSMQEFIKATLAKSKAVDYVSTKGGTLRKSPQKVNSNNSNANQPHGTPLSTTKSIKTPNQQNSNKRSSQSSSKQIPGSQRSIESKPSRDRDDLMKKRNEAIQKMKNMKGPQTKQSHPPLPTNTKKTKTKGMDAKSLLEMVRHEEQVKKNRELEIVTEKIEGKKDQRKKEEIKLGKDEEGNSQEKIGQRHKSQDKAMSHQEQMSDKQKSHISEVCEVSQTKQPLKPKEQGGTNLTTKDNPKTNICNKQTTNPSSGQNQTLPQGKPTSLTTAKQVTLNNRTSQQQSQTLTIKQQINPVLSSSDTESDSQPSYSSKAIKGVRSKKVLEKQYCPIPEEEIQESIAVVKEEKAKEGKITHEGEEHRVEKEKNNMIRDMVGNQFGRIVEEIYHPYGNDCYNDAQNNNDDAKDNSDNSANNNYDNLTNPNHPTQPSQPTLTTKPSSSQSSTLPPKPSHKTPTPIDEFLLSPSHQQTQPTNKIYNEEYWLHIKEEAEAKIQRFKQEKEIERKERELKEKMLQEESKRAKEEVQRKRGIVGKGDNDVKDDKGNIIQQQSQHVTLQQDPNDVFIQQQKQNLKKIYSSNQASGASKKPQPKKPAPSQAIIKQPKPSFPRPQFNYLQLYPSFNHLFNVFYTKPQAQSVVEIPSIMKQIIETFTLHLDYQKNKKNNFRPAIFLPFDNRNGKMTQFSDARQMLKHAETTYVNLKTLVERVEVFNSNLQGQFENTAETDKDKTQFYRVVKTREEVYDIITTSFLRRKGWKQLPHGQNLKANWNLFWSWSKPEIDMNKLLIFQRINHFPFNKNLSRKDLLYKNIDSFRKQHKVPFPYLPITYNLPKEFSQFSKRFHQEQLINRQKNYWIMKPIGKSRGRGIKLINSLGQLNYLDNIVVQRYIANPLLIEGYKFDMRIYVLVTSFHPLEAFVYREGFARFSTEKYSLEPMDMKNNFVHLTNFAINKNNNEASEQFAEGSKISLKALKEKVTKMGHSFASVWSQVHEIIIKSLLACSVSVPPFPAAFQLFGYDIMIDDQGQCYLIQINSSPSLERSYMIDEIIKQSLIDDIIEIVNPPNFSKEEAINVMNERLSAEFMKNYGKKVNGKVAGTEEEDLIHMARILKYQKIRKYGQMPEKIGLFQMVAPSPMSKDLQKLIKSKSGINAPHNID